MIAKYKVGVVLLLVALATNTRAQEAVAPFDETPAPLDIIPVDVPAADEPEHDKASRPSTRNPLIEEIVVTAQKKSESINDVPIAISAFTGDTLKTLGMTDTRDLGKIVPGFNASDSGYNTPVYTLRGVGFNDTTYTATSTVGVYEDEVNLPYSIMTKGAALDLQRVEVLKGPQGILYGRNTTGGAINYIANKPTETFEAGLSGTYGRFNTADAEGFVSGQLTSELNGRLAGKVVHSWDGNQFSNTRPDDTLGKQDKQSARGILEWAANDQLSFRFVGEFWSDDSQPRAAQVIFISEQNGSDPRGLFLPARARNYPTISQSDADPQVADWNPDGHWQLHDRFFLSSARTDWKVSNEINFTGLVSAMRVESNKSSIPQSGFDFNNAEQVIDAHINTGALEMRLSSDTDSDIDWMVGTNLSRDTASEAHLELVDSLSAVFPDPVTGQSTLANRLLIRGKPATNQYAGFLNTGFKFAEAFKLTVGGRFTQTDERYTGCSGEAADSKSTIPGVNLSNVFVGLSAQNAARYTTATGMPGSPTLIINPGDCFTLADNGSTAAYQGKLNESNVSYRVALDWKPTDEYLFYGSLGRGYKAGGFPVLTASGQDQLTPVKQEELLAFELGAKTSFFDKQLHTNVAVYDYDYKNKQLLTKLKDPVFGPLPVLKNAPKSEVYGAELNVEFAPEAIEGLFLAATGAYTHTEIKEFSGINSSGNVQDFAGKPFNFAPELQYTFLANYSMPVNDQLGINLGADYYHSSSTNSTIEQDSRFSFTGYSLIGLHGGVSSSDKRWSLTAFVRNLTNELYPLAAYQNGDAISRITGAARTYGLTLGYDWQ